MLRVLTRRFANAAASAQQPPSSSRRRGMNSTRQQFTGSYLDATWTKRFVLGYVLQNYAAPPPPQSGDSSATPSSSSLTSSSSHEDRLLSLQHQLSEEWSMPAKPLDVTSTTNILRLIGRYATGQGFLSLEAMSILDRVGNALGHEGSLENPVHARILLERCGFVEPGDNLRRLVFRGELTFADAASSLLDEHLSPVDPYDSLRTVTKDPIYAIDSASTSEVDDAIGVHVDEQGIEWFTVFVSDATVHCPFDSSLEKITARTLTTTSYLPEKVFFMLPKPIIEAATLRDDRPCRTFNIVFRVDPDSGDLHDFRVAVGWVEKLRRITYDAVQELYDHKSPAPMSQTPAWVTHEDIRKLHRIHDVARLRLEKRVAAAKNKIESNLPDPLIKVKDTTVVSVTDQILSTKDARIAVAELMIAANEVCSRVAQAAKLPIPYRGTRIQSRDHLMAMEYHDPNGTQQLQFAKDDSSSSSLEGEGEVKTYFAQAMFRNISALSSVTRAVYFHEPLYHSGLNTTNYSHSTSPLRRYADMLVHHQLKTWVALNSGGKRFEEAIPEYQMASLCSMISVKQEQAALLQDSSSRFWLLKYIAVNLLQDGAAKDRVLKCLVGCTRDISASPWYRSSSGGVVTRFVSDVYLPELQMTHLVFHNRPDARVGTTLDCRVRRIDPTLNVLDLDVVHVSPFEASAEEIMKAALLPASDS